MQRRIDPIIESVKQLAGAEQKGEEYMLCQIGKSLCNQSGKRKLAKIFEKLGEETDNYLSDTHFKYTLPDENAIQLKVKCMLSVTDYDNLREALQDYLIIPCYKTISKKQRALLPTEEDPEDFKMNGKTVGKFWSPKQVIQNTVEDVLNTFLWKFTRRT